MADDRHARRARAILACLEHASDLRRHAEEAEELIADDRGAQPLGLADAGGVDRLHVEDRDALGCVVAAAPGEEIGIWQRKVGAALTGDAHLHQPIGIGKRQRPQQDGFDDREDGRRGADPERQRQDGDEGESRALQQQPDGVADVVGEGHAPLDGRRRDGDGPG